jgi:ABC-type antimicrobial peptide transport system permease subunit
MTFGQLLFRNLRFHWRGNLAVCLGVAVGTAVLTGALLVGDSLQGSLRDLSLRRLGWVNSALIGPRFFRAELAKDIGTDVRPVLLLQGSATTAADDATSTVEHRVGRVTVLGVGPDFWPDKADDLWASDRAEVVLGHALAEELQAGPDGYVYLNVQKASTVPRETLLGRKDSSSVLAQMKVKVHAVLPDAHFGSQFSLAPTSGSPLNAFLPLKYLRKELDLEGRANALLAEAPVDSLQACLAKHITLDDWGLKVHTPESRTANLFAKLDRNGDGKLERREWGGSPPKVAKVIAELADADKVISRERVLEYFRKRGVLTLESRQMILEPGVAAAALAAAPESGLRAAPTLIYLANTIKEGGGAEIPYSIVAALDPSLPAPLGPFWRDGALGDDEILLVEWEQSPIPKKLGDATIKVKYYSPEEGEQLKEKAHHFRFRGFIPLEGVADDPDLTPEFPGITDKLTLSEWDPPFPYDNKRVKPSDEHFWDLYRTTPKAYVNLATGQKLWGSRFGNLTSIRLAPESATDLEAAATKFREKLLSHLKPEQGGLVFNDVRGTGLMASAGSSPFAMLFLGFSFFLILSALLLVGLLFRLNIDLRAGEVGLLFATGYRRSGVRNLLLAEGAVVALIGGVIGLTVALIYARGLIAYLTASWPGAFDRSFLTLHVTPLSLVIGYGASLLVSLLTIAWAIRVLGKATPRALLSGRTGSDEGLVIQRQRWARWIAVGSLIVGLVSIVGGAGIRDQESRASTFMTGGFLLLTAGLAALWIFLKAGSTGVARGVGSLGVRNAGRNAVRSLLTAGLLASAAFLIVSVEAFRVQTGADFLDKNGGSGGFPLVGESDVPIYQDLNQGKGRDEIKESLEQKFRRFPDAPERLKHANLLLESVKLFGLRLHAGDDASCLNLYQPGRPRLLGVPNSLIDRGGFEFAETWGTKTEEEKKNPWLLLHQPQPDGAIPVIAEKNSVGWVLHSSLGGTIEVKNEHGDTVKLRFVGLLQDSVFQSEVLLAESDFLKLYPSSEGTRFFLVDIASPPGPAATGEVKSLLETALADRGFSGTPSAERVASYLAIQNTYISTFQALGGLGLLLGTLGLGVVLLRSTWERRAELALFRAIGFRRQALGLMVMAENAFLLAVGLGIGTLAALLSVAPHVAFGAGTVPWSRLLFLLLLVLLAGLASGTLAVVATLRAPLLPALRKE